MKEFDLKIVTPDRVCYDGKALSILVTTDAGEVQICADHVDYIASLGTGRAKITTKEGSLLAAASKGIITVKNNEVSIVAVTFEFGYDIDIKRAEKARDDASEALLKKVTMSDKEIAYLKARLLRANTRISVYNNK